MGIHASLKKQSLGKSGHRNVLKRFERINRLKAEERWVESTSILGLPKIKSIKLKKK